MQLSDIKTIYFIGIGGIGMSALARYFNGKGCRIYGYDRQPSVLTDELTAEGMVIHFEENPEQIPRQTDLVVYTPAIPSGHSELDYFRDHGYTVVKRSELMEIVTSDFFTIAVGGTHGKTTTSSMVAHILRNSGIDCTAFLGGIAANYNTNFLAGTSHTCVVEADEYDRSFLRLHPRLAVITSCDADHLDIYGSEEAVVQAYRQFSEQVNPDGNLITKAGLPFLRGRNHPVQPLYYHSVTTGHEMFYASGLRLEQGTHAFDFHAGPETITGIHLEVAGMHNVENAVAAMAVGWLLQLNPEKIRAAINGFAGVKRRFEFIIRKRDLVYIDDYAHHPKELEALLRSVREIFPGRKITIIFQPHLYSRTRDFAGEFGRALSLADQVILLPVYAARETPISGVNAAMLLDRITPGKAVLADPDSILPLLKVRKPDVLITAGAGDIDQLVTPIRNFLQ